MTDDGQGLSPSGLGLLGSTRYASSKTHTSSSLGYRGEALASIARVSRLRIVSRAAGSFETWERLLVGGAVLRHAPCAPMQGPLAGSKGTLVEVREFLAYGGGSGGGAGEAVPLRRGPSSGSQAAEAAR